MAEERQSSVLLQSLRTKKNNKKKSLNWNIKEGALVKIICEEDRKDQIDMRTWKEGSLAK